MTGVIFEEIEKNEKEIKQREKEIEIRKLLIYELRQLPGKRERPFHP